MIAVTTAIRSRAKQILPIVNPKRTDLLWHQEKEELQIQNSICYLLEVDQLKLACSSYPNAIFYPEDNKYLKSNSNDEGKNRDAQKRLRNPQGEKKWRQECHHFSSSATDPARAVPWLIHSQTLLTQPPMAMLLKTQAESWVLLAAGRTRGSAVLTLLRDLWKQSIKSQNH